MNSDISGRSETLTRLVHRLRDWNVSNKESAAKSVGNKSNRAAVLICLFEDESGDLRVILTLVICIILLRFNFLINVEKKSFFFFFVRIVYVIGEVALPGGKRDEQDADDVDTALREAQEEIGLSPSMVEVVAVLEPFHTRINITVVPVVGVIWDKRAFTPIPNAAEVESVFYAPLEMFLKDENRRQEEREWQGCKYLLQFFDYRVENEIYVIWALTAGVLIKTASVAYEKEPAFEERRPPFWSISDR